MPVEEVGKSDKLAWFCFDTPLHGNCLILVEDIKSSLKVCVSFSCVFSHRETKQVAYQLIPYAITLDFY